MHTHYSVRSVFAHWSSKFFWIICGFAVLQTMLMFFIDGQTTSYAIAVRLLHPLASFGAIILVCIAARQQSSIRRRWAILSLAFAMLTSVIGNVIYTYLLTKNIIFIPPSINLIFLSGYGFAIISFALYFPLRTWSVGSAWRVVADSMVVALSCLIFIRGVFPFLAKPVVDIITELFPFIAADIGVLFACILIGLRYKRGGNPFIVFVFLSQICLMLGHLIEPLVVLQRQGDSWLVIVSPLYVLHRATLALGAYRSIANPPLSPSEQRVITPTLEWVMWMLIPQIIPVAAIAVLLYQSTPFDELVFALLVFMVLVDALATFDLRRVLRNLAHAEAQERHAKTEIQNQKSLEQAINAQLQAANADLHTINERLATAEQQARMANADIIQQNELRVREVNAVTHDLRRNLQVMHSAAEGVLGAPGELAAPQATMFWATLHGLTTVVDQMRDAVLLRHSRLDLHPAATDLIPLICAAQQQAQLRPAAQACTVALSLEDVPLVWCDPARTTRVLQNLLDNALKYTYQRFQGQPGGQVQVRLERAGDAAVACTISDNGVGIAPDDLARLGQPFVRGAATHLIEGMGLGLAFAKGMIQASGGTFTIASAGPDQGATVTLTLPVADGAAAALATSRAQALAGRTLLLIDDDAQAAAPLARALRAAGVQVAHVPSVAEAMALLQRTTVDVALIDHHLGDGAATGAALVRWMQAQPQLARTLRLSWSGVPADVLRRDVPATAFDGFVTKPLAPQAVVAAVAQYVQEGVHANRLGD